MKTSQSALRMNAIVVVANRGRALGVDIDQDIDAVVEIGRESARARCRSNARALSRAREIHRPRRVARKSVLGEEVIIFAFDLAGARRARGARDGVNEIRRLPQRVAECRLARAGRRGDDEQECRCG